MYFTCVIFLYLSVYLKTAHSIVALLLFWFQSNKLTSSPACSLPSLHWILISRTKVYVTFLKGMFSMFISIVYILVLFLSNKEFLITSILQTFIFLDLICMYRCLLANKHPPSQISYNMEK